MHTKTWTVQILIGENGDVTTARAVLHSEAAQHVEGTGEAHRSQRDPEVPEIGDEVAAARALHSLATNLLATASGDIEAVTHETDVSVKLT
jgi:hypothetical protein